MAVFQGFHEENVVLIDLNYLVKLINNNVREGRDFSKRKEINGNTGGVLTTE